MIYNVKIMFVSHLIEGVFKMSMWKRNLYICWFGTFVTAAGMSQIIPFLPFYIEHLGVHDTASVERWAGLIFGSTFLISAIVSPLWGKLADKYGRKPMLLRASLGMAIVIVLMGFVQNVYELFALRFVMGTVSGFISSAVILVASQTPKHKAGWALGVLSTGGVSGSLLGPLIGGFIADYWGIRNVFFDTGFLLIVAFLASLLFIKEDFKQPKNSSPSFHEIRKMIPNSLMLISMFVTTFMVQLANMSIQPIITVYVKELSHNLSHVEMISGLVVASSGLASVLAAPFLGKLSDRVGPRKVLLYCLIFAGLVFIPQAFSTNPWELMIFRFLLGLATAGLLPCINTIVKKMGPSSITGRLFGYNQSAQYLGTLGGAVLGGQLAAIFGIKYVFFITSALLLINAGWVVYSSVIMSHYQHSHKEVHS